MIFKYLDKYVLFSNRCRLVEELIEPNVTRALLLFSPMYTARSALPNPMRLLVTGGGNDKSLAYEASLRGREELVQVFPNTFLHMRPSQHYTDWFLLAILGYKILLNIRLTHIDLHFHATFVCNVTIW